jgi:flagellar motility protein MotE (MotC chaperone)
MRILPALIVISAMLFAVKVGNIWQDVSGSGTSVVAQAAAAEEAAGGKPEPADKAKAAAAAPQPAPKGAGEKGGGEKAGGDKSGGEKGGDGGASDDPRRFTLSEIRLLQALSKRRKTLEKRERQLAQRQALLKAAEQQLVSRRAELLDIKQKVEQLLKLANKKEMKRINNLVKIYENMKPRDAAVIFNGLEHAVLLEVVERMKVRKVAPVIGAMDPNKARRVTKSLAGRRKGAGLMERQGAARPPTR